MSTKAVIIALVVALVLGIGAYLVLQPKGAPTGAGETFVAGDLVCKVDAQTLDAIEIEAPSGEVQRIQRSPMGGFTLSISKQSAQVGAGPLWAMEEGRVASLVRVLNDVRSLNAPDDKSEMDADAMRVTIREGGAGGKTTHLLLSGRTLGGRGLLRVVDAAGKDRLTLSELRTQPGKLAVIGDAVHNVFRSPGPRAWRDTLALRGVGPEVSRLRLTNNDLSMRLARLEGKWAVQEPVVAPADAAPIAKLIGTLAALRITSFLDDPTAVIPEDAATGLSKPPATITTETDRRVVHADPDAPGGDVVVKTETHELLIGNPAGTDARTRYARLGADGPIVIISADGLVRELFDAASYVSRKAVQAPAADIGMLVIEKRAEDVIVGPAGTPGPPGEAVGSVFRRNLDKWTEVKVSGGGNETPLDENTAKAVEELLKFLTTEDARSLSIAPPAVWRDQGSLVVGSLAGTPIETLTLGTSEGASDLGIRVGEGKNAVHRWYPRDKAPRILTILLPKPTEPVKGPAGEKDIVK